MLILHLLTVSLIFFGCFIDSNGNENHDKIQHFPDRTKNNYLTTTTETSTKITNLRRNLQSEFNEETDVFCDVIYYVPIKDEEQNLENGEWTCNIRDDDGQHFIHEIDGFPNDILAALTVNTEGLSGNAAMLLQNARKFMDFDKFSLRMRSSDVLASILPFTSPNNSTNSTATTIRNNKRTSASASTGTKSVLVLRISGSEPGEELDVDAATLSRRVFGGFDDTLNLKDGYAGCSNNKFILEKASGYEEIVDGVLDIKLSISTSAEASNPAGTTPVLENASAAAAKAKLGTTTDLESLFDFVMMCLPDGTNVRTAYGYIGWHRSVFSGLFCLHPSGQMHEIGHNLKMWHSNDNGVAYDDRSGLMGISYISNHDWPKMCFNGAKSWLFGWYQDKTISLDDLNLDIKAGNVWKAKLLSVGNYDVADTENNEYIIVEIPVESTDVPGVGLTNINDYVLYNGADGPNAETREFANQVTITRDPTHPDSNGGFIEDRVGSSHVGELMLGDQYTIPDYKGSNLTLMMKFCEEFRGEPYSYVDIVISFTSNGNGTDICDMTSSPTPIPSTSPSTTSPTPGPTPMPSTSPPTTSPTPGPTPIPTSSPTVCRLKKLMDRVLQLP